MLPSPAADRTVLIESTRSGRIRRILAGTLACCALLVPSPATARGEQPPPPRILLIGLDAATWERIDPMIAAGRLPHLARLKAEGASGNLSTLQPTLSPALWTTIATGKLPGKHGITDFRYRDPGTGEQRPFLSTSRRARAFWEILGDFGRSSCIINWWISWPTTPISGVMVSDYVAYMQRARNIGAGFDPASVLNRAVYPADLLPEIMQRLEEAESLSPRLVRTIIDLDDRQMDHFLNEVGAGLEHLPEKPELHILKAMLVQSEFHLSLGIDLLGRRHVDLLTYYSKGIDAVSHTFWRYLEPESETLPERRPGAGEIERFGEIIPSFYAYEDLNIGKLLAHAGQDTYTLVISDHGFHAGGHEDAPAGIFLLRGPGVRRGISVSGLRIQDMTPLLLYLLDIPVGSDMDGSVPIELFTSAHLDKHPRGTLPTHEVEMADDGETAPFGKMPPALLEELRALGYVE